MKAIKKKKKKKNEPRESNAEKGISLNTKK